MPTAEIGFDLNALTVLLNGQRMLIFVALAPLSLAMQHLSQRRPLMR